MALHKPNEDKVAKASPAKASPTKSTNSVVKKAEKVAKQVAKQVATQVAEKVATKVAKQVVAAKTQASGGKKAFPGAATPFKKKP